MINEILNYFGYIKKNKIKDRVEIEIRKSNKKLRLELLQEFELSKENYIQEQKEEYSIVCANMNVEKRQLVEEIIKLKKQLIDAKNSYKIYRDNALQLGVLGESLGERVKEILERSGYLYKEFKDIEETINKHTRIVTRDDPANSKLLQINRIDR